MAKQIIDTITYCYNCPYWIYDSSYRHGLCKNGLTMVEFYKIPKGCPLPDEDSQRRKDFEAGREVRHNSYFGKDMWRFETFEDYLNQEKC